MRGLEDMFEAGLEELLSHEGDPVMPLDTGKHLLPFVLVMLVAANERGTVIRCY